MGLIMRSYRQPIIPPFHHSVPPTSYQRWKYQVITAMKKAYREKKWRFSKSHAFLKKYPYIASVLNKLWKRSFYSFLFTETWLTIMWYPFKRVCCQCTFCGQKWYIPARRIRPLEQLLNISKKENLLSGNAITAMKAWLSLILTKISMENWFALIPKSSNQVPKSHIFDHYSNIPLFHYRSEE